MLKKSIIIYGHRIIKEAIESNLIKLLIVFIVKTKIKKYNYLIERLSKKKIPFKIVQRENILKVVNYKNLKKTQGIVGYINYKKNYSVNDIIKENKKLIILVLYNITDTKNIGSIIRTACCFNVNFIIIPNTHYIYSPNIIKISSGAILKIKICRVKNIENSIKMLIKNNIQIISITEKGDVDISNVFSLYKKKSIALILGNEETGIPNNILNISKKKAFIPIYKENISSLNVSIACAIVLYELNKTL